MEHLARGSVPPAVAIPGARWPGQCRRAARIRRRPAGPRRALARAGAAAARRAVLAGDRAPESRSGARPLAVRPSRGRPGLLSRAHAGERSRCHRRDDRRPGCRRAQSAAGLHRQPQGSDRRALGARAARAGGSRSRPERNRLCRLEPRRLAADAAGPVRSLRPAGPVLRRQRGRLARRHARPLGARSGDERRPAGSRRPRTQPGGRVQSAKALRCRHRKQCRGLRPDRRPGAIYGGTGGRLGAAWRHAGCRAAGRDRARELPQPRRPDRQWRRPRCAGKHQPVARGHARGRLPNRGAARERAGSGRDAAGRRHQRDAHPRSPDGAGDAPDCRVSHVLPPTFGRIAEKGDRPLGRPEHGPPCGGWRIRARAAAARQRRGRDPAGARLQHRPERQLPRPGPAAAARLSRVLWLAAPGIRRARDRPHGQARQSGMAAGQGAGALGRVLSGGRAGPPAAHLPVHRQRSRRRRAGEAAGCRGDRRSSDAAADACRDLRTVVRARAAGRRVLRGRRAGSAAHGVPARRDPRPERAPRPRPGHRDRSRGRCRRCFGQARQPPVRAEGTADPRRSARVRPSARGRPAHGSARGSGQGAARFRRKAATLRCCARSQPILLWPASIRSTARWPRHGQGKNLQNYKK